MPPKAAYAAVPRRTTPRAAARKSIPSVCTVKSSRKSTTDALPETRSRSAYPTTTPTTSLEPVCSLNYLNTCPATTAPETTPIISPEPRKAPPKTACTFTAVGPKASLEELLEVSAAAVPETTSDAAIGTASKTLSESSLRETSSEKITETNIKKSEESRDPIAQVETQVSENATIEAAVPGNAGESGSKAAQDSAAKTGTRTVVKKTVRIVKKVVKKKVPKRVQKGQAVQSGEESGKVEVADDESKNPNPSLLGVTEIENPNSLKTDSMEVDNLSPEPNACVSIEVENHNTVAVMMEAENSKRDATAFIPVADKNSHFEVSGPMQVQNPEDPDDAALKESDSMIGNFSEAPVEDLVEANNNGNEDEQAVSATASNPGDQILGLIGQQSYEIQGDNLYSEGNGGEEGAKEGVGKFDVGGLKGEVGMGDGLVLSGEMEAMERRKRRKTEIFIGGLEKDAKEEDIRKVFQEVGEIVEVRVLMNDKMGKNKGFAFVRYASAADAKKALAKFPRVEICGKQCTASPVEGNDTLFLGNIDKKWKSEDILKLLQEIGIEKIDKVTVMANPSNIECNRGFAFLELETSRDAQTAYRKLQMKDAFGKKYKIKVAWAEPLSEPDEEEMLKVKSVYAEYLPSSWDEDRVKFYFKKFGEIENVVLARNLPSSRRKDFAFVNYTTREAALACIEAFSRESLGDEGSKVNVKVSLAKPIPKGKQIKHVSNPVNSEHPKQKLETAQSVIKPPPPKSKEKIASINYGDVRVEGRSSTTAELVHLLREQASWSQRKPGSVNQDYPYPSPARKRPFSLQGDDPLYSDPRGSPRMCFESSFASANASELPQCFTTTSLPYYHRPGAGYAYGSLYGAEDYPNSSQTRGAPYHGSSTYHRCDEIDEQIVSELVDVMLCHITLVDEVMMATKTISLYL